MESCVIPASACIVLLTQEADDNQADARSVKVSLLETLAVHLGFLWYSTRV
jgi:hypothetical protein